MKILPRLILTTFVFLAACAPSDPDLGPRETIGAISFQNVPSFTSEDDGQGGVYLGNPDAEITIVLFYLPTSMFPPELTPRSVGAIYPEERFPFELLLLLGFEQDIELSDVEDFDNGTYTGYTRHFTAHSVGFDPIEGEYVVFDRGDHVFIAMGSVVHVTGANDWFPEGKIAFDLVVNSVRINPLAN